MNEYMNERTRKFLLTLATEEQLSGHPRLAEHLIRIVMGGPLVQVVIDRNRCLADIDTDEEVLENAENIIDDAVADIPEGLDHYTNVFCQCPHCVSAKREHEIAYIHPSDGRSIKVKSWKIYVHKWEEVLASFQVTFEKLESGTSEWSICHESHRYRCTTCGKEFNEPTSMGVSDLLVKFAAPEKVDATI